MILAIASGKGGTGKTTVATNMAAALVRQGQSNVRLLDCDVEEPNDHLFVRPHFTATQSIEVPKPVWNEERCTGCGRCAESCNYNAIAVINKKILIFPELCHACGVCTYVCPEGAIHEEPDAIGTVESGTLAGGGFFAHGTLDVGEVLAPSIVAGVKEQADPDGITIIDASPGTACPVVKALEDVDVAILVTEPTPFGLHDLSLCAQVTLSMRIPTGIVVNRSKKPDDLITSYAEEVGVPILGRIPFDRKYAEAYSRGELLVETFPELADLLIEIYRGAVTLSAEDPPALPPPDEPVVARTDRRTGPARDGAAPPVPRREMTVISGKGGTGKTTVMAALAGLASEKVLSDCDVDAADLHLLLAPEILAANDFFGGQTATIDPSNCAACGRCAKLCHFDAIRFDGPANDAVGRTYRIDQMACEGCGLCGFVCPMKAVEVTEAVTGQDFVSRTRFGRLSHARLNVAEENSGKLVTRVRTVAGALADGDGAKLILNDGSPGIGCPVVASISGTDLVLIIAEPTVSGLHDMKRVLALARHFGVRPLVCVNKSDLNPEMTEQIRRAAVAEEAGFVGSIPFDECVNDALAAGRTILEAEDGPAAVAVRVLWETLRNEFAAI